MDVSYDPVKNARNITERGLSFELVQQFDWTIMTKTNKPDPEMIDDENPEWTEADFRRARPATEILPESLQAKLGIRRRGPQKDPTKERITIRMSTSVLAKFRATGPGWQSRIDTALQEWLRSHQPR